MYFKPKAKDLYLDKLLALFYGVVTPSLNPIIYSLRNEEVKAATIALLRGDLSRKMAPFPVVLCQAGQASYTVVMTSKFQWL